MTYGYIVTRSNKIVNTSYSAADISGNYSITVTGGDGLAMITNAHTREDGGATWGNRVTDGSTVNLDFDYDAIKAAHRTAALITGPTGKPLNINLDTLIVSRGYGPHNRALEILGAINRGFIPGSADRDGSAAPVYKVIATPWTQTNTAYWWMKLRTSTLNLLSSMAKALTGVTLKKFVPAL